ncbi:hypothetical protein CLW00_102226 [Mongoliibacter ruber]|uniref:Uncharacterized protein n=1 Tax=Mongoliibacter ruber TaxID=1750599 RepID=A0A2T0WST5_9BACT|nr:hypothetical protein CLW00_102226 [Mongoliibacter ruber]
MTVGERHPERSESLSRGIAGNLLHFRQGDLLPYSYQDQGDVLNKSVVVTFSEVLLYTGGIYN